MRRPKKDIQLTSYDELLGLEETPEKSMNQVVEIDLAKLYPFKNHPFHVNDDEKMAETVESIKTYGVLTPALVRPRPDGGYEMISGHRRKRGCELCGKTTLPALVRNYTDDEAVIIMVDSNIQRENLLPSEKAHAYKMKYDAMKHAVHIILLGNIDMKIPALIMLRRTQELILTFIFYSEHPVELFKKEMDDNSRTVSGFNELKDYIKNYPYSMKYNIDDAEVQEIASKVIEDWTRQYKELSNFVHGTNSNFFQKTEYLDEFKFIKKDVNFLTKQVEVLSSIVNTLLIIFYFEEYIKFDETTEKSLIRSAISNNMEYKKKIVEVLKEI